MFRWLTRLSALLLLVAATSGYCAEDPFWIDVRSEGEYQSGHVSQAVNIPYTEIAARIGEITEDKDAPIYLYCRSGRRSGIAKETLEAQGFTQVTNVGGLEDARAMAGEAAVQ